MFGANDDFNNAAEDTNVPTSSNHQTLHIKDLSTATVTLYPNKARITRNITNVALRSGSNEVEIYGLSPTVDEQSIQIEGQGNAAIVDMTVQLVPNRDVFEEEYPEESEEEEESDESDTEGLDEKVKEIIEQIDELRSEAGHATEARNSANERLATLDRYAKSATAENMAPDAISMLLGQYQVDRKAIWGAHSRAAEELARLTKKIRELEKKRDKAGKGAKKQKERKEKQKAKELRKKQLKKQEKAKHARYLRQERLRYWPKKVYRVTLTLEPTSTLDSPASSRRGSLDSITLSDARRVPEQKQMSKTGDVDSTASTQTTVSLLLTYVTREASWAPRYDLQISSVQKTATIIYRTEFLNRTSETWKDAKVSFSTSQTSYQGLDDTVPTMHAWRVKLDKDRGADGGLLSREEMYKPRFTARWSEYFNRADAFGLDDNYIPVSAQRYQQQQQQQKPVWAQTGNAMNTVPPRLFGSSSNNNVAHPPAATPFGSGSTAGCVNFGRSSNTSVARPGGGLFGSSQNNTTGSQGGLFGGPHVAQVQQAAPQPQAFGAPSQQARRNHLADEDPADLPDNEDTTPAPDAAQIPSPLDFDEASWEDNGLTATYDCPRPLTLDPSSLTRRHKIASLHASNITLSHISVPKLRSAAFLRAKIRNPSPSITLLKGSAGVSLDGSFLGNMVIPRVSPLQTFDLSLGVDPGVSINYPKPNVKRSTSGVLFNKETAQVYERAIWITNTKSSPIDLLVLDQVPVSEFERLRINILTPRGLVKEGDKAKAGADAKVAGAGGNAEGKGAEWGGAVAQLKKNGEVSWTVNVKPQKACLLRLEYEARLPPGESIVAAESQSGWPLQASQTRK